MREYLIIHAYAIIVFLLFRFILRLFLGRSKEGISKTPGGANGIVGLEVIKIEEE